MCEWNAQTVAALLDRNDLAVERAVLAIFARQTSDEQESESTKHHNGRGFSAFHAGLGSYYARWLHAGRHLTGVHLAKARSMMKRYVNQLVEAASASTSDHTLNTRREFAHV